LRGNFALGTGWEWLAALRGGLARDAARWEWRSWLTDRRCVFFWRVLDALDFWLTQARLWLADAVCGPRLDGDTLD
jgi:hypothetical protein